MVCVTMQFFSNVIFFITDELDFDYLLFSILIKLVLMKKKILIVYPGFPHYRKGIIEALIADKDFEFYFIGDETMMNSSINPYTFRNRDRFTHIPSHYIGPFLFHKKLLGYINANNFDGYIFHSAPFWITIYIAVFIAKFKRKPILNWTHGILYKPRSIQSFVFKLFYKPFDGFLLYGNYAKENMIRQGFAPENLIVINNSLDYESQVQFRKLISNDMLLSFKASLFKDPQLSQLLFIGRLYPQKKLEMLIDVFHLLHNEGHKFNLLIVGNGIEKNKLQYKVEGYGLADYVNFYGPSYNESDNFKLIASSDCCISPGEVGLTAIHSMMYGTPVISHDRFDKQMPEFEAIISGYCGGYFKYNDLQSLKDSILEWFSSDLSRETIRLNCYERVDSVFNPMFQKRMIKSAFSLFKA